MRLIELEIYNVRGIPHIVLRPNGKNFAIMGPNGSGKSAVVDALDFLLTGRISRLTGEGTGGITLSKHGPHIGSKPEDAWVRALIQVPGLEQPVEIKRCIFRPGTLECSQEVKPYVEPVLEVARRGQHVLTRREILKYITSDASTRAGQIQNLLDASEVEEIRKALVRVQNDASREVTATRNGITQAKGAIISTTQQKAYHPEQTLSMVNQLRAVLGGQPLEDLDATTLKAGIIAPAARDSTNMPNPALVEKDAQNLLKCLESTFQASISSSNKSLRTVLEEARGNSELIRALDQAELTEMGLSLVDDSGKCPLCDTPWEPDQLRGRLRQKLAKADKARDYQERISAVSSKLLESTASVVSSLQRSVQVTQMIGEQADVNCLQGWLVKVQGLNENLRSALDKYPLSDDPDLTRLFAPLSIKDVLGRIVSAAQERYPKVTPEQTAWDTLTRLEENIKGLQAAEKRSKQVELWNSRATLLRSRFEAARDAVLGGLYDSIRDRFVDLYRKLHNSDEKDFTATLEPDGAGLDLEVDFHGRGIYPPHALHSEGHQDSMGLCLYLALSERLTAGMIDLVILDDVVMSVDADHRRQLCTVLATEFKDRQFLITTHDRNWAGQLRSEGVVASAGSIEFFNWNVDTGPQVNDEVDLWDRIEADLSQGDVPGAAAKLRRGSEEYMSRICDALGAKVPFKLSGRYELGELMQAAMGRYKELLGKAKKSAQSWGHRGRMESLKELASVASSVFNRTNVEQWAVNPNVHYNQRVDFTSKDFAPVRDAFHDLFDLFRCRNCGAVARLLSAGSEEVAVKCSCGSFDWNLTMKPKE